MRRAWIDSFDDERPSDGRDPWFDDPGGTPSRPWASWTGLLAWSVVAPLVVAQWGWVGWSAAAGPLRRVDPPVARSPGATARRAAPARAA